MRQGICCAGLLALSVCAGSAQTTAIQSDAASPAFEVASVKPAAPMTGGRVMVRMSGGPGSPDPGQITYTNVSMKNLLTAAYNVKGYQISGPAWLESERYDIAAKIPKGASKEQFQLMLQNLLAERFKLTLHREAKDLPIYALVVGKNGLKMKESPKDDPAPEPVGGPSSSSAPPPPPPSGSGPMEGGAAGRMKMGKDGMPQMPPGAGRSNMMMMMADGGRMRVKADKQSASAIAEMLGNQLGRPVVDQTGLKGNYDYVLEFAPDDATRMPGMMAGIPHPPPADGGPGGTASNPSDGAGGPTLTTAIQEQLGLKLESKKGPIDLLVIDRLEKVPSEN